jgi:hypothetical protein
MISARIMIVLTLSAGLVACHQKHSTDEQQQQSLQHEAMQIIKQFASTLKPKLKQALQEGDPARAIETCSKEAPRITKQLNESTQWTIKRVSLKPRNHNSALPDPWEREVLQRFDKSREAGADITTLTATDVENGRFRFMKAQPVEQLCLLCHGTEINPEITAALKKHYPQDRATGYSLGDIRGAFSLSKALNE